MKTQNRTGVVFLLLFALVFTYVVPVAFAEEDPSNQNTYGQGDPAGYQQQGPTNTTNQSGGPGGNQSGGYSQNGSGRQENKTQNCSDGQQYRYRYQRRFTRMEGAANYTRIRAQCRQNVTEEAFEIFFTIDTAPTLQLSYIPNLNASRGQHHFNLVVEQLIEYSDENTNGKYDDADVVVSSLVMSNTTFSNITYTNSTTPSGKTVTIIETHTLDNLFSIIIYLVSERTVFLNNTITHKEIKIDFKIINYPFTNQSSRLALITQVDTPFAISSEHNTYDEAQGTATQESGLNISSANHSGFFTWANNVMVDNITYPVSVTAISKKEQTFSGDNQDTYSQTQVIFSYPRGEVIVHDPKIGIVDLLEGIVPSVLQFEYLSVIYLVTCVISGIVFYGIVHLRKNR